MGVALYKATVEKRYPRMWIGDRVAIEKCVAMVAMVAMNGLWR
jgi:hypothetical protein